MRQPKSEVVDRLVQQPRCEDIVGRESGCEVACLASRRTDTQLSEQGMRIEDDGFTDSLIHGPAGTPLLEERSRAVESDVTNFSLARFGPVINPPIHYQSAADAAAEGDIKNGIRTTPGSMVGFAEGPCIGVVVDGHREMGSLAQPFSELKIRPTHDLMRAANPARFPIHGPTKADPHGRRVPALEQGRQGRGNLRSDAGAAAGRIDGESVPLDDRAGGISCDDLQFGAANFDSNKMHEEIESIVL